MRIALAALVITFAAAPAAHATEPVTSTSVTVTVGSSVAAPVAGPVATPVCELSMVPGRAKRVRRFTGRLTCDGRPAAGAVVRGGDAPVAVRADGRIVARVTVRRSRIVTFSAMGLTVRIPVKPAR